MKHELKTWPEHFQNVWDGVKTFELRKNDRDYKVGDKLFLREFDPTINEYTGNMVYRDVTHILEGGQFGLQEGYIIMSIE